jgi:hypothetical protein
MTHGFSGLAAIFFGVIACSGGKETGAKGGEGGSVNGGGGAGPGEGGGSGSDNSVSGGAGGTPMGGAGGTPMGGAGGTPMGGAGGTPIAGSGGALAGGTAGSKVGGSGGTAVGGVGGTPVVVLYPPDIMNYRPTPMTSLARPGYLVPIADPDTGNTIMRITDSSTMQASVEDGLNYYKHQYAKNQPWNADESLVFLPTKYPGVLLDGKTFRFKKAMPSFVSGESLWSNKEPAIRFGVQSSGVLRKIDVNTGVTTDLATFPEYSHLALGFYEGNISNDDRLVVLAGQRGANLEIFTYDIVAKRKLGTLVLAGTSGNADSDFCTISPSGQYVAVYFSTAKYGYAPRSLQLYDVNMKHLRQISTSGSHVDFQYDVAGDEVVVVRDNDDDRGSNDRGIFSVRLSDGRRRREMKDMVVNWATHTSCRNIKRPGWCYVSEFATDKVTDYNWSSNYNEIFAIKLDGSGTVERFAKEHHNTDLSFIYNNQQGYARSAMAVPNLDGSLVIFASDWQKATLAGEVHTYVAGRKLP